MAGTSLAIRGQRGCVEMCPAFQRLAHAVSHARAVLNRSTTVIEVVVGVAVRAAACRMAQVTTGERGVCRVWRGCLGPSLAGYCQGPSIGRRWRYRRLVWADRRWSRQDPAYVGCALRHQAAAAFPRCWRAGAAVGQRGRVVPSRRRLSWSPWPRGAMVRAAPPARMLAVDPAISADRGGRRSVDCYGEDLRGQ